MDVSPGPGPGFGCGCGPMCVVDWLRAWWVGMLRLGRGGVVGPDEKGFDMLTELEFDRSRFQE